MESNINTKITSVLFCNIHSYSLQRENNIPVKQYSIIFFGYMHSARLYIHSLTNSMEIEILNTNLRLDVCIEFESISKIDFQQRTYDTTWLVICWFVLFKSLDVLLFYNN